MDGMVLSAYGAMQIAEKLFDKSPELCYHNIIPGYLTFDKIAKDNNVEQALVPVWRILVTKTALQKVMANQDVQDTCYFIDLFGNKICINTKVNFVPINVGTVFEYLDGKSIMLEACDHQHHKLFVAEPKIAIGIKKGPFFKVNDA